MWGVRLGHVQVKPASRSLDVHGPYFAGSLFGPVKQPVTVSSFEGALLQIESAPVSKHTLDLVLELR